MANAVWDVASTAPGSSSIHFQIGPGDVSGTPPGWSVVKRTLHSGVSAGVEMIDIDNGRMKIAVLATRGMGVWAAEAGGQRLGWKSPVRGPVHPRYVSLMEPAGKGWLAGFDELMVRCGMENNGAPVFDPQGRLQFPLHGRIANLPAHSIQVEVDPIAGTIVLRGTVDELRFHGQKLRLISEFSTNFGSTSFGWRDRVVNLGGEPAIMQMLYHINVGEPFLVPGSRLIAPIRSVSPHDRYPENSSLRDFQIYPGATSPVSQQSFFFDLLADERGATQVLLERPARDQALSLRFSRLELPCFSMWRNNVPSEDGYVTALEPGTNFPNPRPFEEQHDRVVRLSSGDAWQTNIDLDWHFDQESIRRTIAAISQIQSGTTPIVYESPQATWSAIA